MNLVLDRQVDCKHEFKDGLSRQPILEGKYSQASFERCSLKPGSKWRPDLYKSDEKQQLFIFTKGKGFITTSRKAFNINEVSVFVPEFDAENFEIYCSNDSKDDLEFLHIETLMSEWEIQNMSESRITLPRFRTLADGWTYWEPFKGPDTTSLMLIEHRNLGRLSMGAVLGEGPSFVGNHIHNELQQWYFMLPGSTMTFTDGEETTVLEEGDILYIPRGSNHASTVNEGEQLDYIWFELCEDGYPGGIY